MAKRTFLTAEEIIVAAGEIRAPRIQEFSEEGLSISRTSKEFSLWLGDQLQKKFEQLDGWEDAEPVALGSWARDELCPSSDIDLIFCGKNSAVKKLVDQIHEAGFRLRYRVPQNLSDWTVGVEPFDVLAILQARAFHWKTVEKLVQQQAKIEEKGLAFKTQLMKAMKAERRERFERYNSISNFLEPNIKYGPGGLRDLQQALYVSQLYPDRFVEAERALKIIDEYKVLFLSIRQKLHLIGGAEVLTANEQLELADWMGFADHLTFMKTLQTGLARVSFYADWMVAQVTESKRRNRMIQSFNMRKMSDVFSSLKSDPGILMQAKVRENIDGIFRNSQNPKKLGRLLNAHLKISEDRKYLDALFRSRTLEKCLPDLHRVSGLSQHDHYHRYTVDEHIRQAVLKLKGFYDRPQGLGRLKEFTKDFGPNDWKILLWSALFHDLAKGLGGDHSTKGEDLVKEQFTNMGLSLRMTVEVAWMVRNHLILSTAAFRMNPQAPSTWKRLHELGVRDKRLKRLAVFTAVDIQATNPEAWSDWKQQLLYDLVKGMQQPHAQNFMSLLTLAEEQRVNLSQEFIREMDPFVIESVPVKVLLEDYRLLKKTKKNLPLRVLKNRKGEVWVRFHRVKDETGLFYRFVQWLFASGCRVQQSSVKTLKPYGVYDWFHVKTSLSTVQLTKRLEMIQRQESVSEVKAFFEAIQLVSEDETGVVLSFRGRDRKGLLISAARALHDLKMQITWAKVHTWGRQIEDVFSVQGSLQSERLLAELKTRLLDPDRDSKDLGL